MRVALVGPPQSGKSSLFQAVAEASGSHIDMSRPDQPHLAVIKVPDERVLWLAEQYHPEKVAFAELEFLDLPGFDLTDDAGRTRARTHWAAMRQSDLIAFVLRVFEDPAVAPYRNRVNAAEDLDELLAEMLFADLDQVTARIGKLEAGLKKPSPKREEQLRELELMQRLAAALEAEKPITGAFANEAEAKMVRSFMFLSQKPALVVQNCAENALGASGPETFGPLPCIQLSAKIELELAQLPPADRVEFLSALGLTEGARDRLIRACYKGLNLVSFLTVGEDECRAWTIPSGTEAVVAAGAVHSDIARGFIRAETVSYEDFRAAGDMKGARAAGRVRLEGKTYVVQDGDIINYRFSV